MSPWTRHLVANERLLRRGVRRALRAITDAVTEAASLPASLPWPEPSLPAPPGGARGTAEVEEVAEFGSNPGRLRMLVRPPAGGLRRGAPLIVVLHGCGQEAARFALAAGWAGLADRIGAPLLLPEQAEENNRGRCFNWFRPADVRRGRGEALSIRQMVAEAARRFRTDPRRVFVAGLSAGGAMAASLLAAYPEVFAAGAAVAGLPVGCAADVPQALARMSHAGPPLSPEAWAERARALAPARFAGPWPRLSVWQGLADHTVNPQNAENLAAQWAALHGLDAGAPALDATVAPRVRRRAWGRPERPAVELWTVAGMDHGFPVDPLHHAGRADRWVLDVGLPAAERIGRFWGLG